MPSKTLNWVIMLGKSISQPFTTIGEGLQNPDSYIATFVYELSSTGDISSAQATRFCYNPYQNSESKSIITNLKPKSEKIQKIKLYDVSTESEYSDKPSLTELLLMGKNEGYGNLIGFNGNVYDTETIYEPIIKFPSTPTEWHPNPVSIKIPYFQTPVSELSFELGDSISSINKINHAPVGTERIFLIASKKTDGKLIITFNILVKIDGLLIS